MGMVELMMLLLTMTILFAMSIPIIDTLFRTTGRVNNTYSNVNQQLVISTNLQRLIRSAVAPAPSPTTGTPVPAFQWGAISPTSVTFYTNIGDPNGPEKVTASCSSSGGGVCASPTSTFTVTVTPADPGTCPFSSTSTANCTWGTTTKTRTIINIANVTNGPNGQPLFVYAYGTSPGPGQPVTLTTVCAPGYTGTCTSTDATVFNPCTVGTVAQPFANCLAGEIQSITFDLQINGNTSTLNGGNQAEEDTGVFVLSSISMIYDPSVG